MVCVLYGLGYTRGAVVALHAEFPVYLGVQAYVRPFGRAPHLRGPVVTHQIGDSIWLPHDADSIWQLLRALKRAPGLNPDLATAYRVLGFEVVTVPVPRGPGGLRSIARVDPEGTGCRLTVENVFEAPQGVVRSDAEIQVWR